MMTKMILTVKLRHLFHIKKSTYNVSHKLKLFFKLFTAYFYINNIFKIGYIK